MQFLDRIQDIRELLEFSLLKVRDTQVFPKRSLAMVFPIEHRECWLSYIHIGAISFSSTFLNRMRGIE